MKIRRTVRDQIPADIDVESPIAELHLHITRQASPGQEPWVQLDAVTEKGQTAGVFNYQRGTLGFGDELLGMTLFDARELMRKRDIAYATALLNPAR